jgi:hypothetical protein
MQDKVKGEIIEVGGESIPITPENAPRIRRAIAALRAEVRDTQAAQARYSLGIIQLQARLDACFDDMSALSRRPLDIGDQAALQGLIRYTSNKLKRLVRLPTSGDYRSEPRT